MSERQLMSLMLGKMGLKELAWFGVNSCMRVVIDFPSEKEQTQAYKQFLTEMPGQRVVVRTLDIGGDKNLGMLKLPQENNPFLGFRAIRIGLAKPEILRPQLQGTPSCFGIWTASNYVSNDRNS